MFASPLCVTVRVRCVMFILLFLFLGSVCAITRVCDTYVARLGLLRNYLGLLFMVLNDGLYPSVGQFPELKSRL